MLTLFFCSCCVYSQVIYTDIPDTTPNATYSLDLNNDSVIDFLIQFDLADKIMCKPQNNNAYSGNFVDGVHLPWALPTSSIICDTLTTWYDANNFGTMALGTTTGYWVGETNKYLALKLIVGSSTYYGWLRMDILSTSTSFTIKDYAYQSTPNTCIFSGQTLLNNNDNSNTNFSIFPNPCNSSTTIESMDDLKKATLTIYNSFGETLTQVNNISGKTIPLSCDYLPSGCYFIKLTEEDKIIAVKKLIIAN